MVRPILQAAPRRGKIPYHGGRRVVAVSGELGSRDSEGMVAELVL
jgi:hypothetical protein